jgi:hypothetical protein
MELTLTPWPDVSAASWITTSDLPWQQLVTFGPPEFEAYARLRFLPDPVYSGQPEIEIDADGPSEHEQLRATVEILSQHTRTPDDCYFCLWDGWGSQIYGADGTQILNDGTGTMSPVPGTAPAPPPTGLNGPKVVIPHRAYFLFHGTLSEFCGWDTDGIWPGHSHSQLADPAFIWPADHSWCVANDVDPHYAGVGADSTAINDLLAHPGLDVVLADPRVEQPHYG